MVDSIVDNHSLRTARKVIITIHVSTITTAQQIEIVKTQVIQYLQTLTNISSPNIYFSEITKGALLIQIDYVLNTLDYASFAKSKDQTNIEVIKILNNNNVLLSNL
jgi:small-conductance mechanosensitive channel